MTLLDKIYWVYKSSRPVTRAEKGAYDEQFFRQGSRGAALSLPEGFEKKSSVTFGAAGDLISVDGLEKSKDFLYDEVADLIFDQDVSFASLESQLTDQEIVKEVLSDKESPVECCSMEQYNTLKGHRGKNFTVMHTACNHTLDLGIEGVERSLNQLEHDNIVHLGTNREPSGQGKGTIIDKNGIKIGFASATFGLNGREAPKGKEYMVNVAKLLPRDGDPDLSLLKRQIESCRDQGCDVIIASLHWGYEFEFFPRARQVEIAHELVEYGADVIIGHHPHVVQPVEYYRTRRDKNRIAVIAYSLGSLTWSFSAPHLVLSALLNLSFAKGTFQDKGKTYIERATIAPVFRAPSGSPESGAIQIRKLYDCSTGAEGQEARKHLSEIGGFAELVFGKGDSEA
jgi:poly-gamma-glutamate synthesis protein (capsule biosynthesis protein)